MSILDEIIDDSNDTPDADGIGKLVRRAIEVGVKEGAKVGPGSWGAMKVRLQWDSRRGICGHR
jgi:hypothetical protein